MNAPAIDTLALPMVSGFGKYATDRDGSNPDALTTITFYDVRDLVDEPQQKGVEKDCAQWLIPTTHKSRKNHDKHGLRPLIWADLDEPTTTIQQTAEIVRRIVGGCDFEVYASRSATPERQKCRILIPLAQALTPPQWLTASEVLDAKLTHAGLKTDPASMKLGQVLYLPNQGQFYDASSARDGDLLQPLVMWAVEIAERKADLVRQAAEVKQAQEAARTRREALQASRSTSGFRSVIDAFNAAYDVSEVLTRNGYDQRGDSFRHPASSTGSYSANVWVDDQGVRRVNSLSSNDPLGGGKGAHDAFSAFRVLEHGGNRNAALNDAGDNHLTIGGESWNKVQRREFMKQKQEQQRNVEPVFGALDPETGELMEPEQPKPKRLVHVDVLGVWSDPSPPPAFVWGKYLPRGTTTLFGAHGGTGKSTIGLMLAVATAAGLPLFGAPTAPTPAIFVSLEDGADIVRHRLGAICRWLEVDPRTLAGKLFVVDGTEHPELYWAENRNGNGTVSDTYAELRELVESTGAGLVLIDNASDAYASDEIVRRHVRTFIRHLNLIAKHGNAAVVLLSHVDKTTSRNNKPDNSESYSGSTAWHNSVRSRLYLSRKDESEMLTLKHEKSNYGRKQEPLTLLWPENGFPRAHHESDAPDFSALVEKAEGRQQDNNAAEVLKMLAEFEGRGQYASTALTARNNVYALLKAEPQFKRLKIGRDVVTAIVNQCQRAGWIEPLEVRTKARTTYDRWAITEKGRKWIGLPSAATAATAATSDVTAETAETAGGAATAATS